VHEVCVNLHGRPRYFLRRVLPPFFSCALTVHVIDFLFLRQCFMGLQDSVHPRSVAICGTGVQYRASLRLCQLTFAHALLEPIVHWARWLRQLPRRALQGRIVQKGQQLLHRAPQGIIVQAPRHLYLVLQVLSRTVMG
jgi:hypothetical protein